MKKLITLGFCLFFLSSSFGQKLDYDKDSKWFFGFNVGGTWNTTDVKNKTNFGWGLTLGRSFNYNYGKKVSFDLRLRYLGGNWYGQDYDTTNVTGNSLYQPDGAVVDRYDTLGYTINNFNTEAHEIGLELVLHLNSLREKTGWDPYIFGGAGLVWSQTQGDLYSQDALDTLNNSFYQYSPNGISKAELNQLSDDIYDTPLDGSVDGYSVTFVPNLGIGLAYQVGPKFSIGLEHRTMFSLRNTFDGYAGNSKKWGMDNDLYHYSGLMMKFNIGRKTDSEVNTNTGNNGAVAGGGCKTPEVDFRKPGQRVITVESANYDVEAIIKEIAGRDNIQFVVNGSQSTNFTYNLSNEKFQSSVLLKPGQNTLVIKASNACGVKEDKVTINYKDCLPPQVNFTTPSGNSITVDQVNFVVNATVTNAENIEYQFNGLSSNNYTLNGNSFASNLRLQEGLNTVRIIARNACGTDEETVQITYSNCATPTVNLLSGTGTITATEPVYTVRAEVGNVAGKQNIQFKVNGVNRDFTYNTQTRKFQSSIALNPGSNNLQIVVNNECGNDVANVTVEYNPCVDPVVSFIQPAGTNTTVNTPSTVVKALIQNVTSASQIQLKVNGIIRLGGSYNPSTQQFEHTISLVDGENTIEIKATNACGSDVKTTKITKRPCVGPQLTMVQPSTQVTSQQNSSLLLKTVVMNVNSASQIKLFLNGLAILGGTYNASTHIFQKSLNLNQGTNTIKIIATNDCSSEELVYNVTYTPCVNPAVSFIQPAGTNTTVNTPTTVVKALVQNVTSASQIQLKVNGIVRLGGTYNPSTQLFEHTISLVDGENTVEIKATNACGSDVKTTKITKRPCVGPQLTMVQPSTQVTSQENSSLLLKTVVMNVSSASQIKLFLNGIAILGGNYNASTHIFQKSLNLNQGTNTIKVIATNDCSSEELVYNVTYTPCVAPGVTLVSPASPTTTSNTTMQVSALVTNVSSANQIVLTVNGSVISGGSYNASTQLFTRTVSLASGSNTIMVKATNECGSDQKSVTATYRPCHGAEIAMIAPTTASTTVENSAYTVKATITNVTSSNQIQLNVNGAAVGGGTLNAGSNLFQKSLTLNEGTNTITITATNDCGTETETFVIVYKPCVSPIVTILTPAGRKINTDQEMILVKAKVQHVDQASQITLMVNGKTIPGGTYNASTQIFQQNIRLSRGLNKINVVAKTDCGQSFGSVTVNFSPCVPPTLALIEPTLATVSSQTGSVAVKANVQNIASANQIVVTVNGTPVSGGSFNASTGVYENTVTVTEPVSTVVVKATSDCGEASGSFVVKHTPCNSPTIALVAPTTMETSESTALIKATLQNISSVSQVVLTVNGAVVPGGTLNTAGLFQKTISLNVGDNTVRIQVTNGCGTKNKKFQIKREQMITICHHPQSNDEEFTQMEIPLSEWPIHQAHGDVLGPCPADSGNVQEDPGTGTGIGIGGSGGSTGGTVTGQGGGTEDPGGAGSGSGGNGGGGEGGGGKSKEDGGKVTIKPKDPKNKGGDDGESEPKSGKKKGGK